MKENKLFKRILCFGVSVVMVLTIALSPLPGDLFSGLIDGTVASAAQPNLARSQSDLAQGISLVPGSFAYDESFLDRYVRTSGTNLNINYLWKKVSENTRDVKGASDTLPTGTLSQSKSSKHWVAQYKWVLDDQAKAWLDRYSLRFEATMVPNKHGHGCGDDHWSDAYVTIRRKDWDLSTDYGYEDTGIILGKSTERNDRVTVNISERITETGGTDLLTYTAKHLGGQSCGGPKVSGSVFYLVDSGGPYITSCYLASNPDGSGAFGTYNRFGDKSSITAYVVVEFSEQVRMADNYAKQDALTLDLEAYYGKESAYVADSNYNITATLDSFTGDKMIFKFEIPATMNGKGTHIYITGIKNQQSFNQPWDLKLYKADGSEFPSNGLEATSRITDITGNSLDWNYSQKWISTTYFDNVYPTLTSVNMTGSMITSDSNKVPTSWEDNSTNRASTFAAVGDKLGFQVYFSENIKDTNGMKAVLSIKDAGGNPIKLDISRVSGNCITFKDFTVTEGMQCVGRILITSFENAGNVCDLAGNKVTTNMTGNIKSPNQQIFLDRDKPFISTSAVATDGVYVTANENIGGEYFTFPVMFKEDTSKNPAPYYSMINDMPVQFVIETPDDAINFTYYMDNNPVADPAKFVNSGITVSSVGKTRYQAVAKVSDDVQYYLHVRIDPQNDYLDTATKNDTNGVFFNGTIHFYVSDWAGNEATNAFTVKHQLDTVGPDAVVDDNLSLSVDFESGKASVFTRFYASDNYDLEKFYYQWHYRFKTDADTWGAWTTTELATLDLTGQMSKEYIGSNTYAFTFDVNDAIANRVGEFYMTVSTEDRLGRKSEDTSKTLAFNFTKPTGSYSVSGGSPENPVVQPTASIQAAKSVSTETDAKARTLMLVEVPYLNGEQLTYRTYMYDPQKYIDYDTYPDKTVSETYYVDDIFAPLYLYAQDPINNALPIAYGSWYEVGYDLETGDCTLAEPIRDMLSFAKNFYHAYSELKVTFVTSTDFGTYRYSKTTINLAENIRNENVFDFLPANTTIASSNIYLANCAAFDIDIQTVMNENGEDVRAALSEYKTSTSEKMTTYPTLEGVAITFKVANATDTDGIYPVRSYGFEALDYAGSKIELFYRGTADNEDETLLETWDLVRTADGVQTIVLTEDMFFDVDGWTGFKTGWYRLQITVKNLNSKASFATDGTELPNLFTEEISLYIDVAEFDMDIDTYYKEYSYDGYDVMIRDGEEDSLYDFDEDTLTGQEIILSLAEKPSGWDELTYLRFSRDTRTDGMEDTVKDNIRIRVRNATYDALGPSAESSAIWVESDDTWNIQDAACGTYEYLSNDRAYLFYKPVLVDGYQDGAYGNAYDATSYDEAGLTLPMLDGYNLLVYEIISTNGSVKSHELPVFVYGQPEMWEMEYVLESHENGNVRCATISALVPGDPGLENSFFYHGETLEDMWAGDDVPMTYDIRKDVVDTVFYLLDQNGNLSEQQLTIYDVDGNVLDIDGNAPESMYVSSSPYDTDVDKLIRVQVQDEESAVSAKELTLTFDADYSALLLGKTGEDRTNNTQLVTMNLPLAVDENGEYLKNEDGTYATWEAYEVGHYGVFRTRLIEESVDEETGSGRLDLEFWIATKIDPEDRYNQWTVTVSAADSYGNVASEDTDLPGSSYLSLGTGSIVPEDDEYYAGTINIDDGANPDGELGVYSTIPLSALTGYGVGDLEQRYTRGQEQPVWFALAPMITADDIYMLTAVDLFGDEYELELWVDDFGELGVEVSFSTTDPTNQPVTVMAQATGTVETITSIVSDTGVEGTIDPADPSKANITVEDNCVITITTSSPADGGGFVQRKVKVSNIDKKIDDTYFELYDYRYRELTGEESEAYGEVTVYLKCDTEEIYTTNGPDSYTFPMGSKKGDSYTFEYVDRAGNVGTNTIVLPFDVLEIPAPPDTEAPIVTFSLYGIRNNKSEAITDLTNPVDDIVDDVPVTAGDQINAVIGDYRSQEFRIVLSIDDASATKVVAVPAGSAAPTDYSAVTTGSSVDFVKLSASQRKATLSISTNGAFEIYVIDANNNVSNYTDIAVKAIDKEAPVYYADYELGVNPETGVSMVTATFEPENPEEKFELITALSELFSKIVSLETGEYEYGYDDEGKWGEIPVLQDVIRYYTVFESNGEFTFNYRDELGNLGQAIAMVKGMDTSAAIVKSVIWYGTVGNVLPSVMKSSGLVVNRDITAEMNMSKPISDVVLYVYDESAENGVGAAIPADAPVEISFTGTNIYITYTDNVAYQIVAEYTASASGRKGYYTFPAVECIDKAAPVITMVGAPELAADNRSAKVTFTSDEPALLSHMAELGYVTEFVWTAVSNAEKELCFTDKAGNRTVYTLKDLGIDETMLEVWYSTTANGADATTDPQADLALNPGDTFYVKVSKAAEAVLAGEAKGDVAADTWTALTLSDNAGLHIAKFTDKSTGEVVYGIVAVEPKDNIAPIITLATDTVVVDEGVGTNEMLAAIRSGVTATDDIDGDIGFTFTGHPATAAAGMYSLTYTAVDAAGNRAVVYRTLFVMAEGTPILWINDEPGLPFGKVTVKDGENISLRMENLMEGEPVIIKYREGIKTSGQMKYYATIVEDMSFSVTEPGHYTIYVRSQDRVEYVTYIYVEDK